MIYKIYCLMTAGLPVDDDIRNALFYTAREMLKAGAEKRRLKTDFMEGVVTTEFKVGCMGSVAGTIFQAEIDAEAGSTKVSYIVNNSYLDEDDFESASWMSALMPNPEEIGANHPALTAHYN